MSDESIRRFFEAYAERFMASDADAVAAMYEAPLLVVREGRPTHLGDDAAVRDHIAGLMDAYRKAGATQTTIGEVDRDVNVATEVEAIKHASTNEARTGAAVRLMELIG